MLTNDLLGSGWLQNSLVNIWVDGVNKISALPAEAKRLDFGSNKMAPIDRISSRHLAARWLNLSRVDHSLSCSCR